MKRYITYLIGPATGLLLFASSGNAQTTGHDHAAASADQHAMMMTMMADMQAKQKKLDDLVAKMNTATGQAKIDLMAAVITEMIAMHKDMCSQMMNGAASQPAPAPDASDTGHADHHNP
jgi:hypothetical protein